MATKRDIKFRLKPRLFKDPITGVKVVDKSDALITMRLTYGSMRMEYSTGVRINMACWESTTGTAFAPNNGRPASEINSELAVMARSAYDTFNLFDEKESIPTQKEFKEAFKRIEESRRLSTAARKAKAGRGRKQPSEDGDKKDSKGDKKRPTKTINNLSQTQKDKRELSFWDVYHEYEAYAGKLNDWSEMTRKKYETIRFNLKSFRDWKRNHGLPFFDVTFDYLDEEGLQSFVDYLRDVKKYVNTTIRKDVVMLKVVIRFGYRKRYHNNNMFEAFKPALKSAPKKVIFFNRKELEKLTKYEIPKDKLYLIRVRDVFLFQCYTGLRYSDLANLKRCDVHERYIEVTTIKTVDSLRIELNTHSKAILKKYEPFDFKDGMALPVVSNQKMNQYLHELCQMVGFDEEIRITYYRGSQRFDEIKKKYELIGSHTGRRSFICNALSMGISPQVVMKWTGHSDYKAMKPYIDVCDDINAEAMKKFDDF